MENGMLDQIFGTLGDTADWIVETVPKFSALFYTAETGLTLIGTSTLIGLGVGCSLLFLMLIQKGFRFGAR